jgi:potassium-transporting ATPase ATP-binding subunit
MKKKNNFLDIEVFKKALTGAFLKLNPRIQLKNPVMFVVYIGAIFVLLLFIKNILFERFFSSFNLQITIWLWITLLFANFAEAIAEGQGKARADSLKKTRTDTYARKLINGIEKKVSASELKINDLVICEAGDIIPGDGEVIEGIASVDESAITGESAPVIRESGGDRNAVTMGTSIISDKIIIKICAEQGNTFLDKMISLIEGASRMKTPNETALTILLSALTLVFLLAVITLYPFAMYSSNFSDYNKLNIISMPILISLLVCLIPTTIGGLLSAIGISGMERLMKKNVLATSGRAVEASGDVDVLLLDKTGTITYGNRMADAIYPAPGIEPEKLALACYRSSLSDDTAEGKSIIKYVLSKYKIDENTEKSINFTFIPFSANTRMSGVDFYENEKKIIIRKGAADAIKKHILEQSETFPHEITTIVENISRKGGTPLIVSENDLVLGVIYLKDIIKIGIKERFAELRKMGIKTVMITGDNPLTAASIAAEAGVDDFIAEATPEAKLKKIREEQNNGHLVAMIGDGTNDAPALAQSDVGVVMNSGTQTAKEAGNMVDLDSNPTKLIEIVETGKQLLMTRGSLTTFSIANDIAKYFAILPAIFLSLYSGVDGKGPLSILNIMHLSSPQSAILSAIIFNALIIIALIPLALKGVKYKPLGANIILRKNLLIYGGGGLIIPFIGIKIIDIIVSFLGLV